ncbi:MAG: Ig-like domain-containing protein, partial [Acidobacteria bacterium]|nr:Ig-like domain-containing protein [Acidobacteriota bacterium]
VVKGRAAGAAQLTAVAAVGAQSVKSDAANVQVKDPPPFVARVTVSPASAAIGVGMTQRFTARAYDQNDQEMVGVSFNWATSDANVASIDAGGLATGLNPGAAHVRASAGTVVSPPAALGVTAPPVPTAGQVILNEALVAFSTSATQPRADFVELYNTTDRTLDISGLNVSFRPGGNANTVRTVTLPGAAGSDTLRIRPRGYFLIVNGTQTFGASFSLTDGRPDGFDASRSAVDTVAGVGAASPCAGAANCFDLNGSSGGIRVEIGGTKLDGLSYQSGAAPPAAPFNAYGEGSILVFTSGATNDLIRTPNAADTNNNNADFRRNGSTGSVTPKAANP